MKNFFSWPLFKENIKRLWGFSFAAFLFYFFSSSFILLIDLDSLEYHTGLITSLVSYSYVPYTLLNIACPIIASCLVFAYLYRNNSAGMAHAMPFSRRSLFITNYLSGLVLAILPFLTNLLIVMALRGPILAASDDGALAHMLTGMAYLKSFCINALVIFFTYSISVLSAMISGNAVIEMLTAAALNFIAPITVLCIACYKDMFLYGYGGSDEIENICIALHPAIQSYADNFFGNDIKVFTALSVLIYVAVALLISIAASILYEYRRLERAGDSYVFEGVKYFIGACFVFFPATATAMLFDGDSNEVIDLLVGGTMGFIIGWMIVSKSFKIFNLKSLKAFLIGAGFTLLICLFYFFDIGGYATRLPDINKVKVATVDVYGISTGTNFSCKDKANIQLVIDLHEKALDYRDEDGDCVLSIRYDMENGSVFSRYYTAMDIDFVINSEEIQKLYESTENDTDALALIGHIGEETTISIASEIFTCNEKGKSGFNIDAYENEELKNELIMALSKDLEERTYAEYIETNIGWGIIYISSGGHDYPLDNNFTYSYQEYYDNVKTKTYEWNSNIVFNDDYEHLIEVLKKYDILDSILPSSEDGYMIITEADDECYDYLNAKRVEIHDTELQRMILRNATYDYDSKIKNIYCLHILANSYQYVNDKWVDDGYQDMVYWLDGDKLPEVVKEMIREKL